MKMTVKEIVKACGGTLLCGDETTTITSFSTDSRNITEGTLFVPIKGERTDAHTYIASTFEKGAGATLTQEHTQMNDVHAWIQVEDTQTALQQIAKAYRSQFDIPVIGITGSVGKTTTKEMVALALSSELNVMKTEGNQNSQIGLPLTVFKLNEQHEAAVIEMGMSNFGEMSRLAQIAAPNRAVITNIGISHIEFLKTQQNIRSEKLHITDCFTENSVLFLNGDDPLLAELKNQTNYNIIFFGTQPWCDYRAENITFNNTQTEFTMVTKNETVHVVIPILGIHNVYNALAAVAVANSIGVQTKNAVAALATYQSPAMRQQMHEVNGITVIDDSYNASPDSIKSCINVLCSLKNTGKTVAVLADMLELGELSEQAHFDVGTYCAQSGVNTVITIGEQAEHIAKGAISCNKATECYVCQSNEQVIHQLKEILKPSDAVIVKGSRGMHTDEIVSALLKL